MITSGEDSYVKDFGTGSVRWGDYSATVVDPADDKTFLTIQDYAAFDMVQLQTMIAGAPGGLKSALRAAMPRKTTVIIILYR